MYTLYMAPQSCMEYCTAVNEKMNEKSNSFINMPQGGTRVHQTEQFFQTE